MKSNCYRIWAQACLVLVLFLFFQSLPGQAPQPINKGFICGYPDAHNLAEQASAIPQPFRGGTSSAKTTGGHIVNLLFHLIRNDAGELSCSLAQIDAAVTKLNEDFDGTTSANVGTCSYSQPNSDIQFCYEVLIYEEEDLLFSNVFLNGGAAISRSTSAVNIIINMEPRSWVGVVSSVTQCIVPGGQASSGSLEAWIRGPEACSGTIVLTHEIGHVFGLGHYGSLNDNFMTEAVGTNEPCHFTSGQISSMQTFLDNNTSILTGGCATLPTADWDVDTKGPCQGQTVYFTDLSTPNTSSYSWSFSLSVNYVGGTSSSSASPQVQFTSTGLCDVTLTATNSNGNSTMTRYGVIRVEPTPISTFPFSEDFSADDFYTTDWYVEDLNEEFNTWGWDEYLMMNHPYMTQAFYFCDCPDFAIVNTDGTAGPNGTASFETYYRFWLDPWYQEEASLYSPDFDFSAEQGATASFYFSHVPMSDGTASNDCNCYAGSFVTVATAGCTSIPIPYPTTIWNPDPTCSYSCLGGGCVDEELFFEYTTDCGSSWTVAWSGDRSTLNTSPSENCAANTFAPVDEDWWEYVEVPLDCDVFSAPFVRFRFRYVQGEGTNSLYIDDFNIETLDETVIATNTTWNSNATSGSVTIQSGATLTIDGATIEMLPSAVITIEAGGALEIINAAVLQASCDIMWDGIYIDGTTASLDVNTGSTVMDMKNGIVSQSGGVFTLDDAILSANHKHMQVQAYSGSHSGTVEGTSFTAGTLLFPHATERPVVGIDITDVDDISIGNASGTINTFDDMDVGINNYRSKVYVNNNTFDNFDNASTAPGVGIGIMQTGDNTRRSYLYAGWGMSGTNYNFFNDDRIGIEGTGVFTAMIVRNEFDDCVYGIKYTLGSVASPQSTNRQILNSRDNIIDATNTGIYTSDNIYGEVKHIGDIITMPSSGGSVGIYMATSSTNALADNAIENCEVYDAITGIYTSGVNNVTIHQTKVSVPAVSATTTRGIDAESNSILDIIDNEVYSTSSGNTYTQGIFSGANSTLTAQCNNVHNIYSGLIFSGTHSSPTVKGNLMNYFFYGMLFQNSVALGNQGSNNTPYNNKWTNISSSTGSSHIYSTTSTGNSTTFRVKTTPTYYDPSTANNGGGSTSVVVTNGASGSGFSCGSGINARTAQEENDLQFLLSCLRGTLNFGDHDVEMDYLMRLQVYADMRLNPLKYTSGEFQEFYNSMEGSNLDIMADIHDEIAAGNYSVAMSLNNGFAPACKAETYVKQTSRVYLQMLTVPQWKAEQADLDLLKNIADECPYLYGPGVFAARRLLRQINPYNNLTWEDDCPVNFMLTGNTLPGQVSVYPNPTTGQLTVTGLDWSASSSAFQYQIIDLHGKTVQTGNCNLLASGAATIDLRSVENGLYLLEVRSGNHLVHKTKVVVLK